MIQKLFRTTIRNIEEIELARYCLYTELYNFIIYTRYDTGESYEVFTLKESKKKLKMSDCYNIFLKATLVKRGEIHVEEK